MLKSLMLAAVSLILGGSLLPAVSHSAVSSLTWQDILENSDYEVEAPKYFLGNTQLSVLRICRANETQLRSMQPENIYQYIGDEYVRIGKGYLFRSIYQLIIDPDNIHNDKKELIPMNQIVKVYTEASKNGLDIDRNYFYKNYEIPPCEKMNK